jgi:histidine ammonia-lyase
MAGAEALAAAGLAPARLGAKDGLALLNASAVTVGDGALALFEAADLLLLAAAAAALAGEGYAANPAIFDERLAAARPASFQREAAALFRALLEGSWLEQPGAARSIQDALCFRTLSQAFAVAFSAVAAAAEALETELNAAADNPLVLVESGQILSTANFHTPAVALAFDTLAIAFAQLATASAYRIAKLMTPGLTGLPKYLSPVGGAGNGYNSLQKTASALHAEIRLKATPASLDAIPVSETVEDVAPQTPLTIRKLREQLLPFRLLVAIEAVVAAQAVDLRGGGPLGPGSAVVHRVVREAVPRLEADRETGADAMAALAAIERPEVAARLRSLVAGLGLPLLASERR